MITFFATAKPFRGHDGIIQRNALQSWKLLHPDVEVILFGDDEGAAEVCAELALRHLPHAERHESGMKYLNYMFARAQKIARHNYLCYLNCDILLMQDFWNAFERAVRWRKCFLLVGQRWDTDITELIDFRRIDWQERVRRTARTQGLKQDLRFVDFFTFPKDLYPDVPPLVVGRGYWDWWLVGNALSRNVPVVDCTPYMTAIHQNHGYAYSPGGQKGTQVDPLAMQNYQLAGGPECFRWTEDATHRLTRRGHISKKFIRARYRTRTIDLWRIFTYEVRLPVWFFLLGVTRPIRSALGLRSTAVRRSRGKD